MKRLNNQDIRPQGKKTHIGFLKMQGAGKNLSALNMKNDDFKLKPNLSMFASMLQVMSQIALNIASDVVTFKEKTRKSVWLTLDAENCTNLEPNHIKNDLSSWNIGDRILLSSLTTIKQLLAHISKLN